MQELIALYREDLEAEFTPIIETLVGVSKDALNLIRERMEEEGDKIPLRDLISTFEMGADRIGHPRAKDVNTNINVNLGDRLEAARRRAREAAQGIIEAEIIEDSSDGDDR
jgi:predicted RNase H-like HicB family nuclease